MTDEPPAPDAETPLAERRRVRRRRSSSRSRRSRRVQSSIPFTSLRFTRPRLPTLGQAARLACALVALGLSVWTLRIAGRTSLTLDQTRTLLAVNTRGAAAGRLAADQLAAQAQLDAAQMMAAQDSAAREAARAPSGAGFGFGGAYGRSPAPQSAEGSDTGAPPPYGQTSYGPMPYGSSPYGQAPYGAQPPGFAPATSSGNVMGYTLPQAPPH